jgi:hypothetical protein
VSKPAIELSTWEIIKDWIVTRGIMDDVLRIGTISICSVVVVFFFVYILRISKKDHFKLSLAFFVSFGVSAFLAYARFYRPGDQIGMAWDVFVYGAYGFAFYLFCWLIKLLDRIDSYLDKKGLKDKHRRKR